MRSPTRSYALACAITAVVALATLSDRVLSADAEWVPISQPASKPAAGVVPVSQQEPAAPVLPAVEPIQPPALNAPPPPITVPAPESPAPAIETIIETKPAKKDDDGGWTPRFHFKPGDNNLLQMETANGQMKFYAGGRLQIDASWDKTTDRVQWGPNGIGRLDDAVSFRRARYDFGGTFYKDIDFLMEWDFINTTNAERVGDRLPINTPVPTDQWVTFRNLPYIGNLRVGNQKPPIALEHITSSRFLAFLERSLAFDAFVENQNNGFEPGISAFDYAFDKRMMWQAGVFKNTRSIFGWNVGDGEMDVSGRLAGLPVWEDDGRYLVHLAVGASHADLDDHVARYRSRILIRNGPAVAHNIVAEAQLIGSSRDMIVPEFAMNWGPFSLAAEYYAVWTHDAVWPISPTADRRDRGTTYFQGGYVEAMYFLTGEFRGYDRNRFAWGRVIPNRNWRRMFGDCGDDGGPGAWQIAARYDWVNLNSKGIPGNIVHDWTLGLNWYLNPYMKVQWNYVLEYRSAMDNKGLIQALGVRLALDF